MTKETAQPKALNILRPSQPLPSSKPNSILSNYSSSSSASNNQQYNPRKPRVTSVAQLHVTSSEKPSLNIYHPPSQPHQRNITTSNSSRPSHLHYRVSETESDSSSTTSSSLSSSRRKHVSHLSSSSYHHPTTKERPAIEIYKPGASTKQQQPRSVNGTNGQPFPKSSSMTKSFTAPVITSNNKYSHHGPTLSSSSYRSSSSATTPSNATTDTNNTTSSAPLSPPPLQQHHHQQPTSPPAKYSVLSPHQQYQSTSPTSIPTSPNHLQQQHHHHQQQQQYTTITNHQQYQQQHFLQESTTTASSSSSSSSFSTSTVSGEVDSDQEERQLDDNDQSDQENQEDQDSTVLNEARVNRQIADLEISNQSLLAVNAMLEATVRKQASEMAQMKKQMTFSDDGVRVNPVVLPLPSSELSEDEWENDTTFQRLCRMTDKMIEQGQHAITFKFKGMGRVISYTEHVDDNDDDDDDDEDDGLQKQGNVDGENAMDNKGQQLQ